MERESCKHFPLMDSQWGFVDDKNRVLTTADEAEDETKEAESSETLDMCNQAIKTDGIVAVRTGKTLSLALVERVFPSGDVRLAPLDFNSKLQRWIRAGARRTVYCKQLLAYTLPEGSVLQV